MGGRPTDEDVLIGRIALASGWITRDRLDECIHVFETALGEGSLGEIFVERGYLTRERLKTLQVLARRDLPSKSVPPAPPGSSDSAFFGILAVQEGLLTPEQASKCLEEQLRLEKEGKDRQIGEIMVEKGLIRLEDVSRLLKLQKKVVLSCPNCDASYTVAEELAKKTLSCQRCRAPLVLVKRLVSAGTGTVTATGELTDTIIGKIFSGCQVQERIGRGGMATVYKGTHLGLNKPMAVKILAVSVRDADMIQRFVTEARAVAKLEHPNIIQVYNVGQKFGFTFILMQYVEGHTLAEILDHRKKIGVGQAIKIVREVVKGLAYAHRHDLVHRDVKPDNIFVTVDGDVKIGDFGLAVEVKKFRKTDTIMGTPYYMPPEQWRGERQDGRSDIYSLGVTFYYMVTGRRPFEGDGPIMLMEQHLNEPAKPPSGHNPDVPKGVSAVIMKMIAKKPKNRYQTAEELLSDLERVESGREPEAPPDPGDMLTCRFCNAENRPGTRKCTVCDEFLGEAVDVLMMDNEFQCPQCRNILSIGLRMCDGCGMVFCKKCQTKPAEAGTEWCAEHQPPPPQPGQAPLRPVRRR